MTTTSPVQSAWGWALASLGLPWVAQRVWPIPSCPLGQRSAMDEARGSSLPARLLVEGEPAVLLQDGDPSAVVAAVLQPSQAVDEDWARGAGTHVSHDSTHRRRPPTAGTVLN